MARLIVRGSASAGVLVLQLPQRLALQLASVAACAPAARRAPSRRDLRNIISVGEVGHQRSQLGGEFVGREAVGQQLLEVPCGRHHIQKRAVVDSVSSPLPRLRVL